MATTHSGAGQAKIARDAHWIALLMQPLCGDQFCFKSYVRRANGQCVAIGGHGWTKVNTNGQTWTSLDIKCDTTTSPKAARPSRRIQG